MNYDVAYELQKVMRDSEEHKEMMAAQEAIKDDQAAKGMVEEFMSLQMQLEYAKIADAPEQVANDIYRIISEPITEGMKILEKAQ